MIGMATSREVDIGIISYVLCQSSESRVFITFITNC